MGGLIADEREKEGYELERQLAAAMPLPVWRVDLEVERARVVSAAEATVLALIRSGVTDAGALARVMGTGVDTRLPERVLVKLLSAGAIDTFGDGFSVTAIGEAWRAAGSAVGRERVTYEVWLDPFHDTLAWVDPEPAAYGTDETWTIDMPLPGDAMLLERKAELGELVRRDGLPDEEDRAPREKRPAVDLRGFAIVGRRTHWRAVRLDLWRHPLTRDLIIVGYIGDAEHPHLTKLISRHELREDRRRLVPR